MRFSWKNISLLVMLIVLAAVETAERYLDLGGASFWIIGIGLFLIFAVSFWLQKNLAPTFGFFCLLHFTRPANEWVAYMMNANFNGTYFLIPVLIFIALILVSQKIRETIGWWKSERFNSDLIWRIILVVAVSSGAMFWYLKSNPDGLNRFINMLPEGSAFKLVLLGLAYAALNAGVEEFIVRGMLWNGLEKIMSSPLLIVFTQATLFGLSHFWGLPGGWSGVVLTFLLSLFLGHVRLKTGGVLGCFLVHFGINLTQYFMLFLFR